jgi:hypothetical protein
MSTPRRRWSVAALPRPNWRFENLHALGGFQYQHYSSNNQRTAEYVFVRPIGKISFLVSGTMPPRTGICLSPIKMAMTPARIKMNPIAISTYVPPVTLIRNLRLLACHDPKPSTVSVGYREIRSADVALALAAQSPEPPLSPPCPSWPAPSPKPPPW